jgi:hypothetical protein
VVRVRRLGQCGEKEGVERKVQRRKKGKKKREEKRIGGEKGKWSNRELSELVFGQNERGR